MRFSVEYMRIFSPEHLGSPFFLEVAEASADLPFDLKHLINETIVDVFVVIYLSNPNLVFALSTWRIPFSFPNKNQVYWCGYFCGPPFALVSTLSIVPEVPNYHRDSSRVFYIHLTKLERNCNASSNLLMKQILVFSSFPMKIIYQNQVYECSYFCVRTFALVLTQGTKSKRFPVKLSHPKSLTKLWKSIVLE